MNVREQCPNGCGVTMARHHKPITLQYSNAYGDRSNPQTHESWYECSVCGRTYVSSVFKRFQEKHIV